MMGWSGLSPWDGMSRSISLRWASIPMALVKTDQGSLKLPRVQYKTERTVGIHISRVCAGMLTWFFHVLRSPSQGYTVTLAPIFNLCFKPLKARLDQLIILMPSHSELGCSMVFNAHLIKDNQPNLPFKLHKFCLLTTPYFVCPYMDHDTNTKEKGGEGHLIK